MKIHDWSEIKAQFNDNLLLGNGASIAIDNRLSYRSLYKKVCESGGLDDELTKMFDYFHTTNFEFIMKLLLEASLVNGVLNINERKTKEYYYQLRDTLINVVREIHPTYQEVENVLPRMSKFLMGFNTIMSLNYDLLVYWSMLKGNEELKCTWFKDCYVRGAFEKDFDYLYKPLPPAKGSTLVFYPHGSLFLATDIYGNELKLSRSNDDYLLETILTKWTESDYIPLFVSEGTSSQKFRAITRSNYLNSVYDSVLTDISGSLVVYGWSANEQDEHIFDAIDQPNLRNIAVSVHTENPKWESYCELIESRIAVSHNLRGVNLYFFNSHCKGCWIY